MSGACPPPVPVAGVLAVAALLAGCSDAPARCRAEVAASFERLRTSGAPYRKKTTITVNDHQVFQEIAAYIPPDRMRSVTTNRVREVEAHGTRFPAREITSEVIRVGGRGWSKESAGWREWEPGLAQELFGAGMDFLLFPDRVLPADAAFECLGAVVFKDNVYIGYRTKLDQSISYYLAPRDPKEREELEAKVLQELRQMPQEWRIVLVDKSSGLPVHDIVAAQDGLDTPRSSVHFTYTAEIKIDPPVQ
jgi:hypothetical protein